MAGHLMFRLPAIEITKRPRLPKAERYLAQIISLDLVGIGQTPEAAVEDVLETFWMIWREFAVPRSSKTLAPSAMALRLRLLGLISVRSA